MTLSLYEAVVPSMLQTLGAVDGLLTKAEAYAADHGLDPADLIDAIVTEKGVVERPDATKMAALMSRKRLH